MHKPLNWHVEKNWEKVKIKEKNLQKIMDGQTAKGSYRAATDV